MPAHWQTPTPSQSWARCRRCKPLTPLPFGQNLQLLQAKPASMPQVFSFVKTFLWRIDKTAFLTPEFLCTSLRQWRQNGRYRGNHARTHCIYRWWQYGHRHDQRPAQPGLSRRPDRHCRAFRRGPRALAVAFWYCGAGPGRRISEPGDYCYMGGQAPILQGGGAAGTFLHPRRVAPERRGRHTERQHCQMAGQ